MAKSSAGIEAIKKLREKREAEKKAKATEIEDPVVDQDVDQDVDQVEKKRVESYIFHDESIYRVNDLNIKSVIANNLIEISGSLKKLVELLGGEEKEE